MKDRLNLIRLHWNYCKLEARGIHIYTNPRPGQYLSYTHSHFTRAVAATDTCFALTLQSGKAVGLMNGENPRLINLLLSTKRQLHTTYVGAVGWEPHSSSTPTCAGKVDHELPIHWSKGHTYTNPRPGHYLTHVLSHITRAVAAMDRSFALTGAHQHGIHRKGGVKSYRWYYATKIKKLMRWKWKLCPLRPVHRPRNKKTTP